MEYCMARGNLNLQGDARHGWVLKENRPSITVNGELCLVKLRWKLLRPVVILLKRVVNNRVGKRNRKRAIRHNKASRSQLKEPLLPTCSEQVWQSIARETCEAVNEVTSSSRYRRVEESTR